MAILLKNKSKQLKVYSLPHDPYCTEGDECRCEKLTTRRMVEEGGVRGMRVSEKMVAASLSLGPGERRKVPDSVEQVPEVKRDIDARVLGMVKVNEPVDEPAKASAPSPSQPKKRRRARGKKA